MAIADHPLAMRAGDVLWNPLTGEKSLVIESATETGGARIVVDLAVEAGGFVPGGEHVHDHCAEHLEVRGGEIACVLDGVERVLGPGDGLTIAPGAWHSWRNAGSEDVLIRARIEPALRFEHAILVLWGLCADGRTDAQGHPSPLLGALLATSFRRELRFRRPPAVVQRFVFAALAEAQGTGAHARALSRPGDASVRAPGARPPARARPTPGVPH